MNKTSDRPARVGIATSKRHGERAKIVFNYARREGLVASESRMNVIGTEPYEGELIRESAAMAKYRQNLSSYGLSGWLKLKKK